MYEESLLRLVVIGLENDRLGATVQKLKIQKEEIMNLNESYKKKFEETMTDFGKNLKLNDEIRVRRVDNQERC